MPDVKIQPQCLSNAGLPIVLIVGLLLASCRMMPKAEIEIRDPDGNPRRDVPVAFQNDSQGYLYLHAVGLTNAAFHDVSTLTDSNGQSRVYYSIEGHQPGWFRTKFLGVPSLPPQRIEMIYTNAVGETVRTRVWVAVP